MKAVYFLFLALAALSSASEATDAAARACAVPTWFIKNVNVTYSADTDVPGVAEFTIEDPFSVGGEDLSCQLPFNSRCEIKNDNLNIQVQLLLDVLHVSVNYTYYCLDTPGFPENEVKGFVVGKTELYLTCPPKTAGNVTCVGDAGRINGTLIYTD